MGFPGLVVMAAGVGKDGGFDLLGAGAILLFAASWAAGSLYGARADLPEDVIVTLFVQLIVASVPIVILSTVVGDLYRFDGAELNGRLWGMLAFAIVVGSIMTFGVFTWVNQAVSSAVANSMAYVAPVIALTLGALLLGETVTIKARVKLAGAKCEEESVLYCNGLRGLRVGVNSHAKST